MNRKEEDILRTATELFSKYGYHAVGVDRIIAESNVAKMTFYKYFPSKQNLIESVLVRRDQALRESILESMSRCRSPSTKLKAIFEWYRRWFEDPEFHGCMFIKASEEFSDDDSAIRNASQTYRDWLKGVIADQLTHIGANRVDSLASYLVVVLDGLTVKSNMYRSNSSKNVDIAWSYTQELIKA